MIWLFVAIAVGFIALGMGVWLEHASRHAPIEDPEYDWLRLRTRLDAPEGGVAVRPSTPAAPPSGSSGRAGRNALPRALPLASASEPACEGSRLPPPGEPPL